MDVRQLRNALAVLEKGSIGRAAATLRISQPALTKSIRRLEEELQVKLFERTSRGMIPTAYGECLRTTAHAVSTNLHQLRTNLRSLQSGSSGIVEVGAPAIVAREAFPRAIAQLHAECPGALVRVTTEPSLALIQKVQDGKLDFAVTFTASEAAPEGCLGRFLSTDRLVVAARPSHPVTQLNRLSVRQAADYPWILPHEGSLHRHRLQLAFEAEGLSLPQPVIECNSIPLIKATLQVSNCIALISKMWVSSDEKQGLIQTIDLNSLFMTRQIGITWREDRNLSTVARKLMAAIESAAEH
jgi:DNA-binding transcriptional LysR family regulator